MNENAEKLKEGLRDYQIQHTEKVEAYSTGLRDQRDGLEDLWKTVSDMMRTYHDTEIVKECKSITDTIESAQDVTYEAQPDILKMILSKSPTLSGKDCNSWCNGFCVEEKSHNIYNNFGLHTK